VKLIKPWAVAQSVYFGQVRLVYCGNSRAPARKIAHAFREQFGLLTEAVERYSIRSNLPTHQFPLRKLDFLTVHTFEKEN
jgi:hypothetical protein